jgi:ABC-type antimicrobial peptide transport system permease subunit
MVTGVTASNANPLTLYGHTTGVSWPGMDENVRPTFQILGCSYELPETFGMTLLEGRSFTPKPMDTVRSEILITEEAVKVMGLTDPLGVELKIGDVTCVVIGVLSDFHSESLRKDKLPVVLYTHPILNCSRIFVKYKPGATQESLAAIQAIYRKFEPTFTMKYTFQDEVFDKMYKTEKTASYMIGFFAVISLLIATIGIVGLATYHVVRRKKEIGVKRVFGASITSILIDFTKEFAALITIAALIAVPFAWFGADRWLSGFAYHISMPWWVFAAAFLGITLMTIILICLQALKTVRTNPSETLRNE